MPELVFMRRGTEVMQYQLGQGTTKVGRGSHNDIAFPEREQNISRYHAVIESRRDKHVLRDLTGDGVHVNQQHTFERVLEEGDQITLGHWTLKYRTRNPRPAAKTKVAYREATMRLNEGQVGKSQVAQAVLVFDEDGFTQRLELNDQPLDIGKAEGNDLELNQPYVSGFHCRIYWHDGKYYIRDLDSSNGTFLNGIRVMESELPNDVEIKLGQFPLRFQLGQAEQDENEAEQTEFPGFQGIVSQDPQMDQIFRWIERMSKSDASVLINGESGTGKELVARALHEAGPRRAEPFVALNCGAIPKELVESALFGHIQGAFTGALQDSIGVFEEAGRGTLFLDEIGDLPFDMQVKLLRVLETGQFRRIGDTKDQFSQARIVTATHRDLQVEVQQGNFRQDLAYRIAVLQLQLPPLRARRSDIPMLAQFFLKQFASHRDIQVTPAAMQLLENAPWPGNIRELRNTIQRALVMMEGDVLDATDLQLQGFHSAPPPQQNYAPAHQGGYAPQQQAGYAPHAGMGQPTPVMPMASYQQPAQTPGAPPLGAPSFDLENQEKQTILNAIESAGGNMSKAAKLLGIGRSSLYNKIKRYGIEPRKG